MKPIREITDTLTAADSALQRIQERGSIEVGVSLGFKGLSSYDEISGRWTGFDVDIARAVAAAVLGDAEAIEFIPLNSAERFEALRDRRISLGAFNSSITYTREVDHDITFVHPMLHDGEVFATRPGNIRESAAESPSILDVAAVSIAMLAGSTTAANVERYCRSVGVEYIPKLYRSPQEALSAYLSGDTDLYCLDSYLLAGELSRAGQIDDHVILTDQVSLEAMSPVTRDTDRQFTKAVRWVMFALIEADNLGLSQKYAGSATPDGYTGRFLHLPVESARKLGLQPDFTSIVLDQVGGYSDIFERNLGMRSELKQGRRSNQPRSRGGLLYAPLFI